MEESAEQKIKNKYKNVILDSAVNPEDCEKIAADALRAAEALHWLYSFCWESAKKDIQETQNVLLELIEASSELAYLKNTAGWTFVIGADLDCPELFSLYGHKKNILDTK